MKAKVLEIIEPSFRSGVSAKTQKPWNIMKISMEKEDGAIIQATTFDSVKPDDVLEIEQDPEYHSWKASRPRTGGYGAKPAQNNEEVMQTLRMVYKKLVTLEELIRELRGEVVPDETTKTSPAEPEKPWSKWKDDNPATREPEPEYNENEMPDWAREEQ